MYQALDTHIRFGSIVIVGFGWFMDNKKILNIASVILPESLLSSSVFPFS